MSDHKLLLFHGLIMNFLSHMVGTTGVTGEQYNTQKVNGGNRKKTPYLEALCQVIVLTDLSSRETQQKPQH